MKDGIEWIAESMDGAEKPYYLQTWFELLFLAICCFVLFLLFYGLMPSVDVNQGMIHSVAMAKLFADGRVLDAFSKFNMPPVYPLLLAAIIKIKHTLELPRLIDGAQVLNLGLGMASIGLVHVFVRRQIEKPFSFIVTGLYALSPSTLAMAWDLGPQMVFMVLSMACLFAIDYSLSRESVMGGQLSRGEIILCGTFLSLCILSWQVGYLLMVAFLFVMLKRFGLKKSVTVIAGIMLFISPFIARDIFYAVRSPRPYVESSASIMRTISQQGVFKTVEIYADNMMMNLARNAIGDLNLASLDRLARTPSHSGPKQVGVTQKAWFRWMIGLIAIVGAAYGLYQYTGIGTLYLCTYVITALALLPNVGMTLAPVIPLLLFYLYYGLIRTGLWFNRLDMPLLTRISVPVLTAWILLCTITNLLGYSRGGPLQSSHAASIPHAPKVMYMSTAKEPESRLEEAQTVSAHRRAMEWLKENTPSNARVAKPRPEAASRLMKRVSGADSNATGEDATSLKSELAQYDFLVEEGAGKLAPAKAISGYGLKLVYEDVPGNIRIWQVKPST